MKANYPILLVDDEELILATVGRTLKNEGFDVTLCKNGALALNMLKEVNFDIVITDLMMDGVSGLDVLKSAKEINPDTMVILITGYGTLTSAIDSLRLGVDDYLLKPCEKEDLVMRINNCIEKIELRRAVKTFEYLLPVCVACKKVRDDENKETGKGDWIPIKEYLKKKMHLRPNHCYCPSCSKNIEKEVDNFLKHDINIELNDIDK